MKFQANLETKLKECNLIKGKHSHYKHKINFEMGLEGSMLFAK